MATVSNFGARQVAVPFTIKSGASVSEYEDLFGCDLVAVVMPAQWTTAALTFEVSAYDPSDPLFIAWSNLWKSTGTNDGAEYVVSSGAAAAGQCVTLPLDDFAGFRFLRVRSGTAGSPVNQGADRVLTLICRPVS